MKWVSTIMTSLRMRCTWWLNMVSYIPKRFYFKQVNCYTSARYIELAYIHINTCVKLSGKNSEISIPSPAILMIVVIQNHRPSLRFPVHDEDSLSQVSLFRSAVLSQLELHPSSGAFQSITLGCRITRYHQSC